VRGTVKLPTANEEDGAGTGEYDGYFDVVGSGEAGGVELSGFTGPAWRGDPDDIRISDGWRWGVGAGFPARSNLRVTAEFFGEWMADEAVTAPASLIVAEDGSRSPATSRLKDPMTTAIGLTWQHSSGVLLGAAMTYRLGLETDRIEGLPRNTSGDAFGMEFRIGFHRGVRAYVPPPTQVALGTTGTAPAPEPEPQAGPNRPPTVKATCDPCVLEAGGMATLHAMASDPDGDTLTYLWTATGGTIGDVRAATTHWHAETSPGLITFTVTVNDGRGGTASDKVTIRVAAGEGAGGFEDIHFDFDSSAIRRNEIPNLEEVFTALQEQPDMKLLIEGHTCNIGTMEYNLALGERRATAVRTYLIQRGIPAARLSIVSYGEERPAHDNTQESTRQLNRRAVFVIRTLDSDSSAR
jgi:peptidoglycan-associated lipoprotein